MQQEIRFATFNTFNLAPPGMRCYENLEPCTPEEYEAKLEWTARQIDLLNADVIGFQEIFSQATLRDVLARTRRYREAVAFSQKLERTRPHLFGWPEGVAYALICQGKLEEAAAYQRKSPADSYNRLVNEAVMFARMGRPNDVPAVVAKIREMYGDAASFQYGQVYAQLGDRDRAFAALNRAWEIRDAGMTRLKTDPYIDPLRSDPRFADLIHRMNFPA